MGRQQEPHKAGHTATLKFDADKLEILIKDQEPLNIKLAKHVTGRFTLTFRIRDLYVLVQLLLKQRASQFDLSGDEGGLVSVSWSDALGSYAVYLPTVGADGRRASIGHKHTIGLAIGAAVEAIELAISLGSMMTLGRENFSGENPAWQGCSKGRRGSRPEPALMSL